MTETAAMRAGILLMMVGVLLAAAGGAYGQPLATDEDDRDREGRLDSAIVGDTAALKDEGELDLTVGMDFERDKDANLTELYFEVEYGVYEWLEVGIKVPYDFVDAKEADERDVDGFSDVELAVAVMLMNDPVLVSSSLTVSLPTGNDRRSGELGEGRAIFEPAIALEFPVDQFEFVFEVGGEFTSESNALVFETAVAYEEGGIVASLGLDGTLDDDRSGELYLAPGIGFELFEDVDLAFEVPVGLTRDSADWGFVVEVTFGF